MQENKTLGPFLLLLSPPPPSPSFSAPLVCNGSKVTACTAFLYSRRRLSARACRHLPRPEMRVLVVHTRGTCSPPARSLPLSLPTLFRSKSLSHTLPAPFTTRRHSRRIRRNLNQLLLTMTCCSLLLHAQVAWTLLQRLYFTPRWTVRCCNKA
ncbi:hypothetical protein BDZ88DRAFT_434313 [Geranomyces variabilis]|nr:hypothetical protein BDZ88DRAFT_434313 [Geranomyces variabilis]